MFFLNKSNYTSTVAAHFHRVMAGLVFFGLILVILFVGSAIFASPITLFIIIGGLLIAYGVGCIAAYFERKWDAKNRK